MTPKASARDKIDHKLAQAGWLMQDTKKISLSAALGVAVRAHPTESRRPALTCDVHTALRLPTGTFYAQGLK